MERFSIIAIIGNTITPEPKFETISKNSIVVPLTLVVKLGGSIFGRPDGILPETYTHIN